VSNARAARIRPVTRCRVQDRVRFFERFSVGLSLGRGFQRHYTVHHHYIEVPSHNSLSRFNVISIAGVLTEYCFWR
jgi:hypothetical protein